MPLNYVSGTNISQNLSDYDDDADDNDDIPQLSKHSLLALQEFLSEQASANDQNILNDKVMPTENWGLSQFWYDDETATKLAEECLRCIEYDTEKSEKIGRIVCISCPTVYKKLKQLAVENVILLEFDKRFDEENFIFYDYKNPTAENLKQIGRFEICIVDPPYLSVECLENISKTVKLLKKNKVLLCTGVKMENDAETLLGVKRLMSFKPKHSHSLQNEFACFSNYKTYIL